MFAPEKEDKKDLAKKVGNLTWPTLPKHNNNIIKKKKREKEKKRKREKEKKGMGHVTPPK